MPSLTEIVSDEKLKAEFEKRFWPNVDRRSDDECWPWVGRSKHPHGYGRLSAGRRHQIKAHQASWALENGPIPDGSSILHSCDNPPCCNERHLREGTQQDNVDDMWERGRASPPPHSFGAEHHNAKFDAAAAEKIASDPRPAHIVAAQYGVSTKTIYRHRKGTAWSSRPKAKSTDTKLVSNAPLV